MLPSAHVQNLIGPSRKTLPGSSLIRYRSGLNGHAADERKRRDIQPVTLISSVNCAPSLADATSRTFRQTIEAEYKLHYYTAVIGPSSICANVWLVK